jgi:Fumarylacetoacetate (FAA) hydrolase family
MRIATIHGRVTLIDGAGGELVVAIGPAARHVAAADAWRYVAGLSVGQDVSERRLQMAATPPQFSLGKSYPGFGPVGPTASSMISCGHRRTWKAHAASSPGVPHRRRRRSCTPRT